MKNPLYDSWLEKHSLQLNKEWNDTEFIQATLAQLQKDLDKFQISFSIPDVLNSTIHLKQIVLENLTQILIQLSNQSASLLPQLIYTIDLPETLFHSILKDSVNIHHDLAECILVREAYKVYLRQRLS